MATKKFDSKFSKILKKMVEITFDFVEYDKNEVDYIYIYTSMEGSGFFFNFFYKIKNQLIKKHQVNTLLSKTVDVSSIKQQSVMHLGNEYLEEVKKLFVEDEREVPTQIKMIYCPNTGSFSSKINYDLHWSNQTYLNDVDIFQQWYKEIESENKD